MSAIQAVLTAGSPINDGDQADHDALSGNEKSQRKPKKGVTVQEWSGKRYDQHEHGNQGADANGKTERLCGVALALGFVYHVHLLHVSCQSGFITKHRKATVAIWSEIASKPDGKPRFMVKTRQCLAKFRKLRYNFMLCRMAW